MGTKNKPQFWMQYDLCIYEQNHDPVLHNISHKTKEVSQYPSGFAPLRQTYGSSPVMST